MSHLLEPDRSAVLYVKVVHYRLKGSALSNQNSAHCLFSFQQLEELFESSSVTKILSVRAKGQKQFFPIIKRKCN